MVELFEIIVNNPVEFLTGLGLSSASIYAIIMIFKGIIGLITKKSKKAKELLQQEQIASKVVEKLGGLDNFMDNIAKLVIDKLTESQLYSNVLNLLNEIANKDDCPTEIKAYIETVLSQSGNEELYLLYEQAKSTLIESAKSNVNNIIEEGKTSEEEKTEEFNTIQNDEKENSTETISENETTEIVYG